MLRECKFGLRRYKAALTTIGCILTLLAVAKAHAQEFGVSIDRSKIDLPLPQVVMEIASGSQQAVPLVFKGIEGQRGLIYRLYLNGYALGARFADILEFRREGQTYWANFRLPQLQRDMNVSLVPYSQNDKGNWQAVGEIKLRAQI